MINIKFSQKETINAVLRSAIRQKLTPSAAALVAFGNNKDFEIHKFTYGVLSPTSQQPVNINTVYDLASLTKLFGTTVLCAVAIKKQVLSLRERPWPNWPDINIGCVLSHTSGLAAHESFFKQALSEGQNPNLASKRKLISLVLNSKPLFAPGKKRIYSDIGFIALGDLLEKRLGASLDILFKRFYVPLFGTLNLGFHNTLTHLPTKLNLAPSRPGLGSNLVNDDNSFAMCGISGHAGLFGSLVDVEKASLWFASHLAGKNHSSLGRILRSFALHRPFIFGFDKADKNGCTGGYLANNTVGHLGFTGTSVWIEPGKSWAVYVLLTNRILTNCSGPKLKQLRLDFHKAAKDLTK